MKTILMMIITVSYLFPVPTVTSAELYKWTDKDGQVHYQDYPPGNLSSSRTAEKVSHENNFSVMGTTAPESPPQKQYIVPRDIPKEPGRKEHTVELYVTSWCPYCKLARKFFISKGIPFKEYDIEKDESAARRKNELDNRRGVPFAVINGERIHGYSEEAYNWALNKK